MNLRIICFFLIISLSIGSSCADKDDSKSAFNSQAMLGCHNKRTWGLNEMKNKVIGQWKWKHAEYIYAIPPEDDLTGMQIEFRDDLTGTLTNSKVAPLEFTWSIATYNNYSGFSTEPLIPELSGQILFCDNIMFCGIAENKLVDGVNNYYKKIQ